ncbi:MAG: carboxypeptidase-like regulatory domain-containing protein, partial [Bacteroidota bacterium]
MKNMYKFLLLVAMLTISGSTFAQEIYKGKVTDVETGEPIPNVDIRFVGSKFEAVSTADGTFSIERTGDTYTLNFFHEDYDVKQFNTRDHTGDINIQLMSNVRFNQYGQKVSRQELTSESREGFIAFESEDRNYKLWFDNRIYLDGAHYFDNYDHSKTQEQNLEEGRLDVPGQLLKLRRMRFAIKARVGDNWYGEIDFDFDGNMVDIKD